MAKRRRERDRPKAGPDAAYDPNKRVHLDYDDDEPATATELSTHTPQILDDKAAVVGEMAAPEKSSDAKNNDGMEELPNDTGTSAQQSALHVPSAEDSAAPVPAKDHKQTLPSVATDDDDDEYDPEEALQVSAASDAVSHPTAKQKSPQKTNARPGKNQATNMKPALGSLSYQWEDADSEGWASEEDEAMAYLRSVREERQALPTVFVAAKQEEEEDLYDKGDSRGYMVEDCYIARPIEGPAAPATTLFTPREAYTKALAERFLATRDYLLEPPPPEESQTETPKHHQLPPLPPYSDNTARKSATRIIRDTAPSHVKLHELDYEAALGLLQFIESEFLQRGQQLTRYTSAWIWALLAKLDDVGAMNNDEVSVIRELGKRAVIVQISFKDSTAAAELEEVGRREAFAGGEEPPLGKHEEGIGASEADAETSADTTDASNPDTFEKASDTENTLATLDMILTIVGEVFRQRDLLEFRRPWENEE